MKSRTHIALAAASSLALSTFAFGQQTNDRGQTAGAAAGQSSNAQYSNRQGQGDERGGMQAEQQIRQSLDQIAQDPNTAADKLFLLEAAKCNLKEEKFAQAVEQKASNDQVKQLAQKISQDHQQAESQLQQAAQKLNLQLPQQLSHAEQKMIDIIASLPPDQLDKQFVADMNADHARDILKYQCEANMGKDEQVKQLAQTQLPLLQQHHQQIQQTAQAVGVQTGMEAITAGAKIGPEGQSSGSSGQPGTAGQTPNSGNPNPSGNSR